LKAFPQLVAECEALSDVKLPISLFRSVLANKLVVLVLAFFLAYLWERTRIVLDRK
jgi:hypothetical protein